MSLRKRVFEFLNGPQPYNLEPCIIDVYETFSGYNKTTLESYFYQWLKKNKTCISGTIELATFDTEKEMISAIQKIKDPDKRATQISRLHAMRLRPVVNKNKKSLKEMFDGIQH